MTAAGGSTFCSWTWVIATPALYWSMIAWVPARTWSSIWPRASVRAGWIGVRPITSRIMLSAADLIVFSGLRVLNRKSPASRMRQRTTKSMSMMFSSPVSISDSSTTSRPTGPRTEAASPERKPMKTRFSVVTRGVSTDSTGQGMW